MDEASIALFKKLAKEQWLEEYKSNQPTCLFFFRRCKEYRKVLASLAAILQQGAALPSQDTDIALKEIAGECGEEVAAGITALSLNKEKGDDALRDSLARIRDERKEIWLVKMADRIANLDRPHDDWMHEKCLTYAEESQLILDALGEASPALAERLSEHIEAWRGWYREGGDGRQVFRSGWAML
ncbi:hypothetical protein FACS189497_04890 [Betaproteobacteria bacterium]|nr:hypothetical protein FACS189488_07850 [Betaproteobacteria bacterium]GHU28715.1 hypothetical protein FACS189497_04890 [Betaproteobacteria bacterium]